MRRMAMLSFVIAGMFIVASAAAARANWNHESGSSEGTTSEMMSPSSGPATEAPEVGTYEYQQALETGNLPSEGNSVVSSEGSSSPGEEIQVIEQGGLKFRLGIDTE